MNQATRQGFYNYILENYTLDGVACRLLNNILCYAEERAMHGDDLYNYLTEMLDGTMGLSDREIKLAEF
jgi:hypothetical protein